MNRPQGLALGPDRTLYIADSANARVRTVDATGRIRTVAGIGVEGFSGDTRPATEAKIFPRAIAVDSKGNLYIGGGERIRRVNRSGVIETFAGTGEHGYDGDGGPASKAKLTGPVAITIDENDTVYFVSQDANGPIDWRQMDRVNYAIRKISQEGIVTRVATIPSGHSYCSENSWAPPDGLARDRSGNFYVPYGGRQQVLKVDAAGAVTVYTGHGYGRNDFGANERWAYPCAHLALFDPQAVALDAAGSLFVGTYNGVKRVDQPNAVTTVIGTEDPKPLNNGDPLKTSLEFVAGLVLEPTGALYVSDMYHHRVLRLSAEGRLSVAAGLSDPPAEQQGGDAKWARYRFPGAVAIGPAGDIFIADGGNSRICRITPDGRLFVVAGTGESSTFMFSPHGGGMYPPSTFSGDGGPAAKAELAWPEGVAVDAQGNIYIADTWNNRIRKVTPDGIIRTIAGSGDLGYGGDGGPATAAQLRNPIGIAVDTRGTVYIADSGNNRIRKVTPDGRIQTAFGNGFGEGKGGKPDRTIQLNSPRAIALDQKDNLYVADTSRLRILKIGRNGKVHTVAGTDKIAQSSTGLKSADSLAIDATGNVYFTSFNDGWIRKVTTDGVVHAISDDGGQKIRVQDAPPPIGTSGIAVDKRGTLYLTDENRILVLKPQPTR